MEPTNSSELYCMVPSYGETMEKSGHHFVKIIIDEKQMSSRIEIDTARKEIVYKVKPSWFCIEEVKMHITAYYADKSNSDSDSSIFLFAKILSSNGSCMAFLSNLFSYQAKMQNVVLPKIEKLLKSQIGLELYHQSEQLKIFFFKDPLKQGYVANSFYTGLTTNDCIETIKLMAKFHAASVALHEKEPELVNYFNIKKIITTEYSEIIEDFGITMKDAIAFMQETYPLIGQKMQCLLKRLHKLKHITELFAYEPEEFCVLNNGDFSTDNLIFHRDNNSPLLRQFQVVHYSSPAIDLHHFLNTAPETAVMYDQDEEMLETYLSTLTDTMKTLECTTKPPTMKELKAAMQRRKLYAVFAGMTFRLNAMTDLERQLRSFGKRKETIDQATTMYEELAKKMCVVMFHRGYFDDINGSYYSSESQASSNSTDEE